MRGNVEQGRAATYFTNALLVTWREMRVCICQSSLPSSRSTCTGASMPVVACPDREDDVRGTARGRVTGTEAMTRPVARGGDDTLRVKCLPRRRRWLRGPILSGALDRSPSDARQACDLANAEPRALEHPKLPVALPNGKGLQRVRSHSSQQVLRQDERLFI